MSLLEWFLEPANPGPVGKVEVNPPEPDDDGEPPKKWLIYLAAIIGLCFAGIGLYWIINNLLYEGPVRTLGKLFLFGLYIAISLFIKPSPDHSNIGWMGGLIDHAFRISDDYNRLLLFTQIILLPGKLIAYCLAMSWITAIHLFKMRNK